MSYCNLMHSITFLLFPTILSMERTIISNAIQQLLPNELLHFHLILFKFSLYVIFFFYFASVVLNFLCCFFISYCVANKQNYNADKRLHGANFQRYFSTIKSKMNIQFNLSNSKQNNKKK